METRIEKRLWNKILPSGVGNCSSADPGHWFPPWSPDHAEPVFGPGAKGAKANLF
jgi:hypothetical protein